MVKCPIAFLSITLDGHRECSWTYLHWRRIPCTGRAINCLRLVISCRWRITTPIVQIPTIANLEGYRLILSVNYFVALKGWLQSWTLGHLTKCQLAVELFWSCEVIIEFSNPAYLRAILVYWAEVVDGSSWFVLGVGRKGWKQNHSLAKIWIVAWLEWW